MQVEKLHELRRARAALTARMAAIVSKEDGMPEGTVLPEEEVSEFDALKVQVAAMDVRIGRVEDVIAAQANEAEPVVQAADGTGEGSDATGVGPGEGDGERSAHVGVHKGAGAGSEPRVKRPDGQGFKAARFVLGVLAAKSMGFRGAAEFVSRTFGDAQVAKALNTSGVATGGALIPQEFSNELIELLRATTVVRKLQPTSIPMVGGNMTIPRLAAGAQAGYQGELDDMTMSQETFDVLALNAKKLTALVPVSNDLVRRTPLGIEAIIRDDLIQTLARREDLAFIVGDGSGGSPIGLLNLCSATNKLIVTAFPDATNNTAVLTTVVGTINAMMLTLEQGFSRMIRPAWIMSPQSRVFLSGLRDNQGQFVFAPELAQGKLMGFPIATTQQIPTNLNTTVGAGAAVNNGSYLIFADFADVIIADTYNVTVEASDVASYKDGGGNIVSAFQRDQSVFRVISEHDFNIRHQGSLAVAVLPGWAPPGYAGFGPGAAYGVQAPSGDSSAAPSTFGAAPPSGSNNPANVSAAVPGGTLPGRP